MLKVVVVAVEVGPHTVFLKQRFDAFHQFGGSSMRPGRKNGVVTYDDFHICGAVA